MTDRARDVIAQAVAKRNAPSTARGMYGTADAILAALAQEGYAVVPVEPTEKMREAAVAEAVRVERERCCQAVCKRCATGNMPLPLTGPPDEPNTGVWVHQYALGIADGMQGCDASAIREEDKP